MAIGSVSLSSSARQNLLALQGTAKLLGQTQSRLASGKKVNSALDGASSFFSSQGFLNSANDLSSLKDSMSTALQTIKAASDTITSLSTVVDQLKGIVNSALQTTDAATRAGLAVQYNDLLVQFDKLVNDGTFNGTNLVNSVSSSLKVSFSSTDATDNLTVAGSNLKSTGIGMGTATGNFSSTAKVADIVNTMTVSSTTANVGPAAYSGSINMTGRVTGATATSGVLANITSAAADFDVSASMTSGATTTVQAAVLLADAGAGNLYSQTVTAGMTLTSGTAITNAGGSNLSLVTISGQYAADGSGTAGLTASTNTLTSTAAGDVKLTIAAGQSVQIDYTQGGSAKHAVYTNSTAASIVINLGAGDTTSVGANGKANSSISYALTGAGSVDTTGLALAEGETIGGAQIVDAGGATTGAVTVYSTADGSAMALGTTTTSGVNAYDTSDATISGIAATSIRSTKVGTAAATLATTANSSVTVTGATQLTGSSTTTVADSITTASTQLTRALATLRTAASSLGNNNTIVSTRQDFTSNLITTLQKASDNLVLADTNEEGANLQSLQASSSLGVIALGISGQQAQAILRLF